MKDANEKHKLVRQAPAVLPALFEQIGQFVRSDSVFLDERVRYFNR